MTLSLASASEKARQDLWKPDVGEREPVLQDVLANGSKWEVPTCELIAKVSSKANYKKRVGSRAARKVELDDRGNDGLLGPKGTTTFRALAARANYQASGRPDVACMTKALCREFNAPSSRT